MTDQPDNWAAKAVSEFEDRHNISVIAMRDFGSRANNMDGPNSDRDAMFIFDQPAMDYKTLGNKVDTIQTEEYGVDFHGWNIRKFAELLADSNPQAIDFLNSEIEYYTTSPESKVERELMELRRYTNRNFNPIRLYMHACSKAKANYEKYTLRKVIYEGEERKNEPHLEAEDNQYIIKGEGEHGVNYRVQPKGHDDTFLFGKDNLQSDRYRLATTDRTVRRNLKVIQAVLKARHIRRTKELPPMDFEKFLNNHVDMEIRELVMDYLDMKRQGEGDVEVGNPFQDLIEHELSYEIDHEELNRRGIDKDRVNEFIEEIDSSINQ